VPAPEEEEDFMPMIKTSVDNDLKSFDLKS